MIDSESSLATGWV